MKTKTIRLTENELAFITEALSIAEMSSKNFNRTALMVKLCDTSYDTGAKGLTKYAADIAASKYNTEEKAFKLVFKIFYDGMAIGEQKGREDK